MCVIHRHSSLKRSDFLSVKDKNMINIKHLYLMGKSTFSLTLPIFRVLRTPQDYSIPLACLPPEYDAINIYESITFSRLYGLQLLLISMHSHHFRIHF